MIDSTFGGPSELLRITKLNNAKTTDIEILRKSQGSKVDPMRWEPAATYNSRALIDAYKPFEWMDEFPEAVESSPEYIEGVRKKWRELF